MLHIVFERSTEELASDTQDPITFNTRLNNLLLP